MDHSVSSFGVWCSGPCANSAVCAEIITLQRCLLHLYDVHRKDECDASLGVHFGVDSVMRNLDGLFSPFFSDGMDELSHRHFHGLLDCSHGQRSCSAELACGSLSCGAHFCRCRTEHSADVVSSVYSSSQSGKSLMSTIVKHRVFRSKRSALDQVDDMGSSIHRSDVGSVYSTRSQRRHKSLFNVDAAQHSRDRSCVVYRQCSRPMLRHALEEKLRVVLRSVSMLIDHCLGIVGHARTGNVRCCCCCSVECASVCKNPSVKEEGAGRIECAAYHKVFYNSGSAFTSGRSAYSSSTCASMEKSACQACATSNNMCTTHANHVEDGMFLLSDMDALSLPPCSIGYLKRSYAALRRVVRCVGDYTQISLTRYASPILRECSSCGTHRHGTTKDVDLAIVVRRTWSRFVTERVTSLLHHSRTRACQSCEADRPRECVACDATEQAVFALWLLMYQCIVVTPHEGRTRASMAPERAVDRMSRRKTTASCSFGAAHMRRRRGAHPCTGNAAVSTSVASHDVGIEQDHVLVEHQSDLFSTAVTRLLDRLRALCASLYAHGNVVEVGGHGTHDPLSCLTQRTECSVRVDLCCGYLHDDLRCLTNMMRHSTRLHDVAVWLRLPTLLTHFVECLACPDTMREKSMPPNRTSVPRGSGGSRVGRAIRDVPAGVLDFSSVDRLWTGGEDVATKSACPHPTAHMPSDAANRGDKRHVSCSRSCSTSRACGPDTHTSTPSADSCALLDLERRRTPGAMVPSVAEPISVLAETGQAAWTAHEPPKDALVPFGERGECAVQGGADATTADPCGSSVFDDGAAAPSPSPANPPVHIPALSLSGLPFPLYFFSDAGCRPSYAAEHPLPDRSPPWRYRAPSLDARTPNERDDEDDQSCEDGTSELGEVCCADGVHTSDAQASLYTPAGLDSSRDCASSLPAATRRSSWAGAATFSPAMIPTTTAAAALLLSTSLKSVPTNPSTRTGLTNSLHAMPATSVECFSPREDAEAAMRRDAGMMMRRGSRDADKKAMKEPRAPAAVSRAAASSLSPPPSAAGAARLMFDLMLCVVSLVVERESGSLCHDCVGSSLTHPPVCAAHRCRPGECAEDSSMLEARALWALWHSNGANKPETGSRGGCDGQLCVSATEARCRDGVNSACMSYSLPTDTLFHILPTLRTCVQHQHQQQQQQQHTMDTHSMAETRNDDTYMSGDESMRSDCFSCSADTSLIPHIHRWLDRVHGRRHEGCRCGFNNAMVTCHTGGGAPPRRAPQLRAVDESAASLLSPCRGADDASATSLHTLGMYVLFRLLVPFSSLALRQLRVVGRLGVGGYGAVLRVRRDGPAVGADDGGDDEPPPCEASPALSPWTSVWQREVEWNELHGLGAAARPCTYAMKCVPERLRGSEAGSLPTCHAEVLALLRLRRCAHVVPLLSFGRSCGEYFLLMPEYVGGSVQQWRQRLLDDDEAAAGAHAHAHDGDLAGGGVLDGTCGSCRRGRHGMLRRWCAGGATCAPPVMLWTWCARVFAQVLCAVSAMHAKRICHGDLKLSNVMMESTVAMWRYAHDQTDASATRMSRSSGGGGSNKNEDEKDGAEKDGRLEQVRQRCGDCSAAPTGSSVDAMSDVVTRNDTESAGFSHGDAATNRKDVRDATCATPFTDTHTCTSTANNNSRHYYYNTNATPTRPAMTRVAAGDEVVVEADAKSVQGSRMDMPVSVCVIDFGSSSTCEDADMDALLRDIAHGEKAFVSGRWGRVGGTEAVQPPEVMLPHRRYHMLVSQCNSAAAAAVAMTSAAATVVSPSGCALAVSDDVTCTSRSEMDWNGLTTGATSMNRTESTWESGDGKKLIPEDDGHTRSISNNGCHTTCADPSSFKSAAHNLSGDSCTTHVKRRCVDGTCSSEGVDARDAVLQACRALLRHMELAVDVWQCGCLLYELITGRMLFDGERTLGQVAAQDTRERKVHGLFGSHEWQCLVDAVGIDVMELLCRMLSVDPMMRPTIAEALEQWHLIVAEHTRALIASGVVKAEAAAL